MWLQQESRFTLETRRFRSRCLSRLRIHSALSTIWLTTSSLATHKTLLRRCKRCVKAACRSKTACARNWRQIPDGRRARNVYNSTHEESSRENEASNKWRMKLARVHHERKMTRDDDRSLHFFTCTSTVPPKMKR